MSPEIGTELINPVAGTKTVFTATAESTDGGHVEIEATYPPSSRKPPMHLHPSQQERFTVLAGSMTVVRGEETFEAKTGDEFVVEPGTPHQMWSGEDGAVMRWRTTPALRTGQMFCDLWEVARDADWQPDPMALFAVTQRYDAEFCLC